MHVFGVMMPPSDSANLVIRPVNLPDFSRQRGDGGSEPEARRRHGAALTEPT